MSCVKQSADTVDAMPAGDRTFNAFDDMQPRMPLATPVEEDFRVSVLRIAWDGEVERVLIEASSEPAEDDDELTGDVLSVRITGAMARAFVARAESVVAAGRPPCPFCTLPLDPDGRAG